MTRKIFSDDRHIYFSKCSIDKKLRPMTVFMNAKFPYDILTLGFELCDYIYSDWDQISEFWRHLDDSVTEIRVKNEVQQKLVKIFWELRTRSFVVKDGFDIVDLDQRYVRVPRDEFADFELLDWCETFKAETLTITNLQQTKWDYEEFHDTCSKDAKIFIETVNVAVNVPLDEVFSLLKDVKVNALEISVDGDTEELLQNAIATQNLPVQRIKLVYPTNEPEFDQVKALLDKHPNIKEMHLECEFSVFPFPFTQITDLNFTDEDRTGKFRPPSFKFLENLINLKSLKVRILDRHCMFGHETVTLPKLRTFQMSGRNCSKCLTALAGSFPDLEKFDGAINVNDYTSILELMFRNWRYLKHMTVSSTVSLRNVNKSVENIQEKRIYLRTLDIKLKYATQYSGDSFLKMSQIFPHLNTLSIYVDERVDLVEVIKGIVPGFKELTTLDIVGNSAAPTTSSKRLKTSTSNDIVEYLIEFGQSLRVSN